MKKTFGIVTALTLIMVFSSFIIPQTQRKGGNWNNKEAAPPTPHRPPRQRKGGNWNSDQENRSEGKFGGTSGTVASGEETDLSGTYTGTIDYSEGGMSGSATLTITGNQFTLTPEDGGAPVSGRIVAVTTRGYTAVTMMFGEQTPPPAGQPSAMLSAVSLRARRVGDRISLTSVPGETRHFSFSALATGSLGGRHRRRRGRRRDGGSETTSDGDGDGDSESTSGGGNWNDGGNWNRSNNSNDGGNWNAMNANRPQN